VELKGAGATAPYVAYAKWIEEYRKEYPGVNLTYDAVGSGEGIKRLEAGTVDFAASDYPLTDEELAQYFSKVKVLHFPTLVTSIVPVYNQAGLSKINFTGAALAGIFSGRIKTWNHPELAAANPGVALPAAPIVVVHRSDSSGSTHTFTDYLSQVDAAWKATYGVGASIKWPVGQAAQGSEALAALVQKTPHSIGYVELNYANQHSLTYGNVKNAAGKFTSPSFEAQGAALAKVEDLSKDFRASIVNAPSPQAYPICTMTWLIVPSKIADAGKRNAMRGFLRYAFGPGLKIALPMDYTVFQPPLIDQVRDLVVDIN
jgi:phosphate transport system substrate-binding protein